MTLEKEKKIDWAPLIKAQKELDAHIFQAKGLDYESTKEKRVLALAVELHELANSTKCFKFWVSSPKGSREHILEEYVDVLHFTLSLCLERKLEIGDIFLHRDPCEKGPDFLSYSFLELSLSFHDIVEKMFIMERAHESGEHKPSNAVDNNIEIWIQKFVDMSGYLGYTWEEVVEAYFKKRDVNVQRQASGKY